MAAVIPQAAAALATEEDERGKRVVLVVDEAHLLSAEQLEAVRLLTNSEMDSKSSCCCLLLGQPTLRRRVKMGAFAAFDQRITLRYHLEGMDLAETQGYLQHHLKLAGRADPLFADSAVGHDPTDLPGHPPGGQQPGGSVFGRHLRRGQGNG